PVPSPSCIPCFRFTRPGNGTDWVVLSGNGEMMFFWKCPVWAVFLPWSLFCAAAVATAQENEADPVLFEPESFPIEYYRKRGLIPEENSLEARSRARERAARTGGAPTLTSATRTLTAPGTFD